MPPLPAVTDVFRAKLLWTIGSDTSVSTVAYFQYGGGNPSAADCLTLATGIYNAAVTDLLPNIGAVAILEGCDVEDLNSSSGAHATYVHATPGGDATGQPLSANNCLLVNHQVTRRYRGGKPRSYFPGPTSAALNSPQVWTAAFIAAWNTNYNTWITSILALTAGTTIVLAHVNISYYQGFTSVQDPTTLRWRNVPKRRAVPLIDDITGSALNPKVGSQRRRVAA
jgi:hypothetical protein